MLRPIILLLALVFTLAPRPGAAEVRAATGPLPMRPVAQGFVSLFQSPPPRIIRDAAGPIPSNAPSGTNAPGAMCRPALVAAEARYGIPTGLLQAIGVVESGRRDEATGTRQPWPWTINAEGEPHFFDTKDQAVAWVRQAQTRGMRSIDTGCAQVNLMHHPDAFASLEQAFDPTANADYAARFLRQLRDTTAGGNWMTAVGYYHSQTPELAEAYRQQVQAVTARGGERMLPVAGLAAALGPMSPFGSAGAAQPNAAARPEPGRVLPAPSGTVGRGLDAYRAMPIQMASVVRLMPVTTQR
jgi:hypothetical protein